MTGISSHPFTSSPFHPFTLSILPLSQIQRHHYSSVTQIQFRSRKRRNSPRELFHDRSFGVNLQAVLPGRSYRQFSVFVEDHEFVVGVKKTGAGERAILPRDLSVLDVDRGEEGGAEV